MTGQTTSSGTPGVAIGPLFFAPLSPVVGADVRDIQLSVDLDEDVIDAIRTGLDRFGVLLFRGQHLQPGDQVTLTERFGPLQEVAQKQYQMRDHPFVYVIGNIEENGRAIGDPSVGRLWHSDQSFIRHPAFGSLLYGVTCPEEGADTYFANMYGAYETLPPELRAEIEHLHAVHSFAEYYEGLRERDSTQPPLTASRRSQFPDTIHPLVRRNARTGRKALYINPGYATGIVEMPGEKGAALLEHLCAHAQRADLVYAHKWRNGDILFWDNLAVNHKGTAFDADRYVRRMHRTTVASNAAAYSATLLTEGGDKASGLASRLR